MKKILLSNLSSASLLFILSVLLLCPLAGVQAQAPANDDCAGAITLTPGATCNATSGTTVGATQSLPGITCNGTTGNADDDVWFKFTAAATSQTITITSNSFNAVIEVRSGGCNGATIACGDEYAAYGTERLPLTGLTVGAVYYIRIYDPGGPGAQRGAYTICVINPPVNDECANAITLTPGVTCTPTSGTTVNATQSLSAITCNGTTGNADDDVWFKFTAAATSQTITVVSNAPFDAVIDVRSGSCNGVTIGCTDDVPNGGTERLPLTGLTIGITYYIRVYDLYTIDPSRGTFMICVENPPANDDCANAITLTPSTTCNPTTGSTARATQSLPGITCTGQTGIADDDVWYKFTAVAAHQTVTVVGANFDAVVDVRSGACNGTSIACADSLVEGGKETVNLSGLTIGSTYYVRVFSRGKTFYDVGTFTICITYSIPANNDCGSAITLTSNASCAPVAGTTINASQTLAGITCAGQAGTADDDVWYKFTAAATSYIVRVVGAAGFNAVVDVRSGACTGTSIACADASAGGGTETVNLSGLTIGNTYLVRVYSRGGNSTDQGTFNICLIHIPPANNECANAIALTPGNSCAPTTGTTVHATQSLPAITCAGKTGSADDDVWYKFTATATAHRVTVTGIAGFLPSFDARSGSCNGTSIGCAGGTGDATETAMLTGLTIGATYYVRVYSFVDGASFQGTFSICVINPPVNNDCANAIALTPGTSCSPTTGSTVNASESLPAITCAGQTGSADDDVWYKFTATATSHRVTVEGIAGFNAAIDVRSGACNGITIGCAAGISSGDRESVGLAGLTIGATYYIRVYSASAASYANRGEFTICVLTPPVNDECANAVTLTSGLTCTTTSGTTSNATQSLAAITCNGTTGTADDDVWYKFTAVSTSQTVTVVGAGFDGVVDVRTGTCNGANIACADASGSGGTETVAVTGLTIGTTYFVRVYSRGDTPESWGTFTICVTHPPAVNDNCWDAVTLTSGATCTPTQGTTTSASQSLAAITCGATTGTADDDVWYEFTAFNTAHTVTVVGNAGFNAVIDVRTGICNGTTIACADATTSGTETVNLTGLTIGTTYFVRVYSRGSTLSDRGTFNICVTHISVANNECANAVTLTSGTNCTPTSGTTVNATQSLAAITCNAATGTADDDVWYQFTASGVTHTVTVVGNAGFNAVVDVRTGTCNGNTLACADATTNDGTETVKLTGLTIGNTYFVRVYSFGSTSADRGTFTICVTNPPVNDECANAITLTSGVLCTQTAGTTIGATQSLPGVGCTRPAGYADDDVWFKFTALTTRHLVTVSSFNFGFDPVIEVRSGSCNGATIACVDATTFNGTKTLNLLGLTVGNTYYIRVYSYWDMEFDQGEFTICVQNPFMNDNCADAISLTSNTSCSPTIGITMGATQSLAAISCNGTGTADDDVWYKFTAIAATHTVTVDGSTYSFDAVVDVRTGSCNGTSIACADAAAEGGIETVNLTGLTVGNTYFVRIYSKGDKVADQGIFSICITNPCPPSLTVSEPITGGTVVKEAVRITATNQVSGGIVTYKAGQSITLQPGFSAITGAGTYFQAITGGCP
ncbi:3-coathanger stack domain-containing protein [Emticicia sp. C21]|uniref:3-coathanger stack domain-containing protein n=1 Tax=Emticicia sp. C21 TaxID=2302915 RepID=UPI000E349698|nr:3-coathanger stack domain-containing protein [Emticicia sp. C21]RFS17093.1 hypothetical protein D0T08_10490 [Emticicia sp. C21]